MKTYTPILAVAAAFVMAGCQNYTAQSADFSSAWHTGRVQAAASEVQKKASDNKDNKDTVIWNLELGTALRTEAMADLPPPADPKAAPSTPMGAGSGTLPTIADPSNQYLKDSLTAFERAADQIRKYDDQAKVHVGSEAGALMVNLAQLPYTGRGCDRIMLHVYAALDYMSLGNSDAARVELHRVYQAQVDAKDANEKRIAESQRLAAEAAKNGSKNQSGQKAVFDASAAQKNPAVNAALSDVDRETSGLIYQGYANYVNPYAVFLDGLFFMTNASGPSDTEHARKSFERLAGMTQNDFVKEDLATATDAANGRNPENLTYVVFETGSAASLQEWKLAVPVPVDQNKIVVATVALPRLRVDNTFAPYLDVSAAGTTTRTELLCNMDAVIAQDFHNEWPSILTKSLISTGLKAILNYQTQKQTSNSGGGYAQLFASLAMNIYSMASTIADTRSWTTLPKQFQYCRIVTPPDRTITVSAPGCQPHIVKLKAGKVNLVVIRNIAPGLPEFVDQAVLSI
ncbi:hypothetical protein GALL_40370 [mine drainage metagenome]|uniref:Lipoprotein n=1 Tax=mine drainage metagenome TaxID=410659 RepID=A0A1J5T230_9ZZZZ